MEKSFNFENQLIINCSNHNCNNCTILCYLGALNVLSLSYQTILAHSKGKKGLNVYQKISMVSLVLMIVKDITINLLRLMNNLVKIVKLVDSFYTNEMLIMYLT